MEKTITIRVDQDWLDKIEAWRKAQAVAPSKSELIRIAVENFIAQR